MYKTGDQVVYSIHGVCSIVQIEERLIDRKKIEYYVLEPKDQSGAKFYVPINNQVALAKMQPVISANDLQQLLSSDAVQEDHWIPDENQRKNYYRELITSGDRTALVGMVHTLHKRKKQQAEQGKKFHLCDENFLRDAEKLLGSEFSVVLSMTRDEVGNYVRSIVDVE